MAHRALVAYRDSDRYTLHYAHWGDDLAAALSSATPFGGTSDRGASWGQPTEALAEQFDLDPSEGYESRTRVDPRPLERGVGPEQLLAAVDGSIESLVVVDPDFESRTYLVCPLGVDGGGPLVLAGPTDDERAVRALLVTVTDRLGERVDAGDLDAATARRAVRRTLERRVPVHPLDDASFLRND